MCAPRREGEPWVVYALRYAVELAEVHARSLLAIVGMAAAVWLYCDFREMVNDVRVMIKEQTASYQQISLELREMNVRISNLEKQQNRML